MRVSNWRTSDRRQRLPKDWPVRRRRVLVEARYRCAKPGCISVATEVDHITPGDNHDYSNLQALCSWHHKEKTAKESAEARAKMRAAHAHKKKLPQEQHPGELYANWGR